VKENGRCMENIGLFTTFKQIGESAVFGRKEGTGKNLIVSLKMRFESLIKTLKLLKSI